MKKLCKYIVIFVVCLYVFICGAVFFYPQPFFYHPVSEEANIKNANEYDYPAVEVKYTSSDGTQLKAWATSGGRKHKMIVFMHGNSDNIEEFFYKLRSFVYDGYGTFLPEYRGFGGLKGKINQKNLDSDAVAAIRFLNKHGYKNSDIYLYGMSLGSHMAIHTAAELQKEEMFAGIILEVPFDNLSNVVSKRFPYFPSKLIVRDKYDNIEEIKGIKSPILIMGAQKDEVVPVSLAENLYNNAPQDKKLIIYKNAKHSNLYNYRNDLDIMNWIEINEKSF